MNYSERGATQNANPTPLLIRLGQAKAAIKSSFLPAFERRKTPTDLLAEGIERDARRLDQSKLTLQLNLQGMKLTQQLLVLTYPIQDKQKCIGLAWLPDSSKTSSRSRVELAWASPPTARFIFVDYGCLGVFYSDRFQSYRAQGWDFYLNM